MNLFRTLRPDEIDCRIAQIKDRNGEPVGLSILLYKDARCDQNILDETVGAYNWKREHTRDNRNCIVSLWDEKKEQWVSKEDTGTESNTEKEKGLASDSFKRACFNWGIGRELYTAPFVWVPADKCNIFKDKRGKWVCYDRFTVKGISYTDSVITGLIIKNQASGKVCYSWGTVNEDEEVPDDKPEQPEDSPEEELPTPKGVGNVEITDKLPVVNFMRNEISDIQEKLNLPTYEDARKQVFTWGDELMKSGAIEKFVWAGITLEQAKNLFDAIDKTFRPGDNA